MTTPDSIVTNEQSSIEYAKIDYKNLPRRRIQPTGHSKIYFLLNPIEQADTFLRTKLVLESVKRIPLIKVIDFVKTKIEFDKLQQHILNNSLCINIHEDYIVDSLTNNNGILFISKYVLVPDYTSNEEILAFSTIKLLNDNRYNNNRYLEVELICSNKKYKHMGTKMLDILVDIAKNMGCKYIHLEALNNVVKFYENYGFIRKKPLKKTDMVEMEFKILSEEEYKESSKYRENYGTVEEYGGTKKNKILKINKRKTNNKHKIKKNKTNKRTSKI